MMQRVLAKRPFRSGWRHDPRIRKPNVLIIITDQEREVMHWPEGWAEANLPARRRLMANGLHFTRAQCNTAACSSSRATFLTGLYPAQHGVKNLVALRQPERSRRSAGPRSSPATCRTWRR